MWPSRAHNYPPLTYLLIRSIIQIATFIIISKWGSHIFNSLPLNDLLSAIDSSGGDDDASSASSASAAKRGAGADQLASLVAARPATRTLTSHERALARSSSVEVSPSGAPLSRIGGHARVKKHVRLHVALPLKHHDVCFDSDSLRPPLGMLLRGPPGTGKTMLARASAVEAGVPMLAVRASDVENKYYGESTKIVRAVFSLARKMQPCIVFVDEIDALMRDRGGGGGGGRGGGDLDDGGGGYSLKCEFLQCLDDITSSGAHVVVIGASNHAASLDTALHRRLPRVFDVPLPDDDARTDIMRAASVGMLPRQVVEAVVAATKGYSGSDMAEVVRGARAARNEMVLERVARRGAAGAEAATATDTATEELQRLSHFTDATIPMKFWMRAVESVRASVEMRNGAEGQAAAEKAAAAERIVRSLLGGAGKAVR